MQAAGERVYIAGIQNGAAKFAWTNNVLVPSPDWTTNNTGLPTSGVTSVEHLRIDPTDPAKHRGYVVVNEVLYRNDAMRNQGTWTAKLTPGGDIVDVGLTVAAAGRVHVLHHSGGQDRVSNSTNNGQDWTTVHIGSNTNHLVNMRVGQNNPNVIYVKVEGNVYKSTDAGATWTFIQGPGVVAFWWRGMELPTVGNTNENELFVMRGDFSPSTWRTLTGNAPFSAYGSSTLGQFYFSSSDGNLAWSFGGSGVWKSTDHASTFTSYAAPIDVNGAALYQAAPLVHLRLSGQLRVYEHYF